MLDKEGSSLEEENKIINEDIESIFDNKKLNKSIRKAKRKNTIKTILISIFVFIIVFVGGYIFNIRMNVEYSEKQYDLDETMVKLTVPNGYISESNDVFGILGGSGTYKIAKDIGGRLIVLEDRAITFGINPSIIYSRMGRGSYHEGDKWPVSLWENGYKKMSFFHPEIQYKEYQNDINNIENVPSGKVIEMAISFDRSYKINELYKVDDNLKPAKITWLWINEFSNEKRSSLKNGIESYNPTVGGIMENEIVGIDYNSKDGFGNSSYSEKYDELLELLSKSYYPDHKDLYKEIMENGKTKAEDAEILGVIVQGTKEELQKLVGNPMIKASTFGVIVDELY